MTKLFTDEIKHIKGILSEFGSTPPVLFGVGRPEQENECEKINVFMQCVGLKPPPERRRVRLDRNTTLRKAKERFGRAMTQEGIYDENGYRFNPSDLDLPLWQFSNKCSLNLIFDHHALHEKVTGGACWSPLCSSSGNTALTAAKL